MQKMNYTEKNKKIWEEHFNNFSLYYPDEEVVRFLAQCKKLYPGGTMLDWGCAQGRHSSVACRMGFHVIATDYVQSNVVKTEERLNGEFGEAVSKQVQYIVNQDVDIEQIQDESVDVLLNWGVLFYNIREGQQEMLDNMYRMVKKNGRVFLDYRTENDSVFKNSKNSSDGMVLPNGAQMTILPLDEVKDMILKSGFQIEKVDLFEFTENNQKVQNSWWHITLLKPQNRQRK